jgi:hypothetical protein
MSPQSRGLLGRLCVNEEPAQSEFAARTVLCKVPTGIGARRRRRHTTRRFL